MKLSLILSVLILVCCGWIGWRDQAAISEAAAAHERLAAEAHELGLGTADLSGKVPLPRKARGLREDPAGREQEARAFSVKLIDFALKMQTVEKSGQRQDGEIQAEMLAVIDELLQLDPAQLKVLVEELRASSRMDDELRSGILGVALATLADSNPEGALALFSESEALLEKDDSGERVVIAALMKLAEQNPLKALDWVRGYRKDHSGLLGSQAGLAILTGAAKSDPRLAFSLIDELGLSQSPTAAAKISGAAKTPAEQSAVLEAMRGYIGSAPDEKAKSATRLATMSGLAEVTVAEGYDQAEKWLATANLSADEAKVYVDRMTAEAMGEDSGKWIAWMSSKLPPEDYREKVGQIVRRWTERDYRAAGSWLNDQPDGPAKTVAVRDYAMSVAGYEPETAAQWGMSLPAGNERTQVLMNVYQSWKLKDAAAAEAFAKREGLGR